jgi:hypothetical protein
MACFYNLWQPAKSRFFTDPSQIRFSIRCNVFQYEFRPISRLQQALIISTGDQIPTKQKAAQQAAFIGL